MTDKEKQFQLAKYRLNQADECIDEAVYLFSGRKILVQLLIGHIMLCFMRSWHLLVFEPFSSSKHSGVLAYFNKRFVKEGIFLEEHGRSINKAFELRQRGDYRENAELTYEQVEPFLEKANAFVRKVKEYLNITINDVN